MIVKGIKFMAGKIKIGIIPTIRKKYNTLEYCIDEKLVQFIRKIFPSGEIVLLIEKKLTKVNLIISSGGNTLYVFSKRDEDKIRETFDSYYLNFAFKYKISFIGICFGAQFIAKRYGSKIKKIRNHVSLSHKVFGMEKTLFVNSYHNYGVFNLASKLEKIFWASDNSIELFKLIDRNIYGMMWHPERNNKVKSFDRKFFREIL